MAQASCSAAAPAPADVYDVIIVGVGAMGVATAYHLAKAGKRVLGLERYTLAHSNGSSHGETRITRLAYWEHPSYVPMLRRSFELVLELEAESGEKLFHRTGSLDIGPGDEAGFRGSVLSCEMHGLPHEVLTPAQVSQRFPAWSLPPRYMANFQPAGGMLDPERIVAATGRLARKHGATLREGVEVVDIVPTGWGVEVHAASGEVFNARKVVLSAGGWMPSLVAKSSLGLASPRLRTLAACLRPERQVVTWYSASPAAKQDARFSPEKFPVWIATLKDSHYYGFPELSTVRPSAKPGIKIGRYHHNFESIQTEAHMNDTTLRAQIHPNDRAATDGFMSSMFGSGIESSPAAASSPAMLHQQTCVFTNTPDEHFILDRQPDRNYPQVAFVSACSGHGFKFSPAIGEAVAAMVMREDGAPLSAAEASVSWLSAGRLLGDRPPLQTLDPRMPMAQKQIAAKL